MKHRCLLENPSYDTAESPEVGMPEEFLEPA